MRAVAGVDRLCTRRARMDDGINPFEHRDVDCSGRSLATLLVAWVGAAMVASVLLRWKYMWIALTILTLLFLLACGYAACNARRAHERVIASEEARILENRRRDRNIQSVSGSLDSYHSEVLEPPAYDAYWITDLPPPYAVAVGAERPPLIPRTGRSPESEITNSIDGPRLSHPPPYAVAILSECHILQTTSSQTSPIETSSSSPERPIIDETTNSRRERVHASAAVCDDGKNANEQSSNAAQNAQTVRPSNTQYLSNIISCTFGIGQRRNAERNSTTQITTRDRTDTLESSMTTISTQTSATSASRISASTL